MGAIQAKKKFGVYGLMDSCCNTFRKEDDEPYIEVHHIIPLYQGGEDGMWNLAVLCAHHHRVAHFSQEKEKVQEILLDKVKTFKS